MIGILKRKSKQDDDNFTFSLKDVELYNDRFHGFNLSRITEWWYFDAEFENGYSVQLGMRVINLLITKLAFSRFDIYKDGKLLSHKRKTLLPFSFNLSKKKPHIIISGKEVIKGYTENGKFVFDLSFDFGETSTDLKFISAARGFEGYVPGSNWTVMLPKAKVSGTLRIKEKEIKVEGYGYHDHNWDIGPGVIFNNYGWLWGKIFSKNYTIIWANILKTKTTDRNLLVITQEKGDMINLDPNSIKIITKDIKKKIPHKLIVDAKENDIEVQAEMDVFEIHHVKIMGFMKYWRFHVKCKGFIKVKSKKEEINTVHMAEFLVFK